MGSREIVGLPRHCHAARISGRPRRWRRRCSHRTQHPRSRQVPRVDTLAGLQRQRQTPYLHSKHRRQDPRPGRCTRRTRLLLGSGRGSGTLQQECAAPPCRHRPLLWPLRCHSPHHRHLSRPQHPHKHRNCTLAPQSRHYGVLHGVGSRHRRTAGYSFGLHYPRLGLERRYTHQLRAPARLRHYCMQNRFLRRRLVAPLPQHRRRQPCSAPRRNRRRTGRYLQPQSVLPRMGEHYRLAHFHIRGHRLPRDCRRRQQQPLLRRIAV